ADQVGLDLVGQIDGPGLAQLGDSLSGLGVGGSGEVMEGVGGAAGLLGGLERFGELANRLDYSVSYTVGHAMLRVGSRNVVAAGCHRRSLDVRGRGGSHRQTVIYWLAVPRRVGFSLGVGFRPGT